MTSAEIHELYREVNKFALVSSHFVIMMGGQASLYIVLCVSETKLVYRIATVIFEGSKFHRFSTDREN